MARERRGHPGKFLNAVEGGLNWALQSYPVSPARGWRGDFTSFITVTSGLLVKCHSSLCPHLCACLPPPTPPHASNSLTALSSLSRGPSQLLFSLNHPEQPSLAITSLEPSLWDTESGKDAPPPQRKLDGSSVFTRTMHALLGSPQGGSGGRLSLQTGDGEEPRGLRVDYTGHILQHCVMSPPSNC